MAGSRTRHVAGAVGVIAGLLVGAAPVAAVADEELIPVPETGAAGFLSLSSSVYPLKLPVLQPGETFTWQIGVQLDQPHGTASLQLTADGEIAGTDTYVVSVDECDSRWQGSSGQSGALRCTSAVTNRIAPVTLSAHRQDLQVPLRDVHGEAAPYLRFTMSRPAGSPDPADGTLTLGIGVTAMGADDGGLTPSLPGPAPLANTGAAVLQSVFAGLGLLLLGAAVLAVRRTARRDPKGAK